MTIDSEESIDYIAISIHTPARGVTLLEDLEDRISEFQSTLPHGE